MPVLSQAQNGFMALSKTPQGRAKLRAHGKKPAPTSVANDFLKASKGMKVSALPQHVGGKK